MLFTMAMKEGTKLLIKKFIKEAAFYAGTRTVGDFVRKKFSEHLN